MRECASEVRLAQRPASLYEGARLVHFFAMAALAGFIAVHLVMVALVPKTLVYMLRGR